MPRKSIVGAHRKRPPQPGKDERLRVLFVDDRGGAIERFADALKGSFECHRATCGRGASKYLEGNPETDLIFLAMSFPTVAEEELLGMEDVVMDRFGGDEEKAVEFVRKSQGAFILHHIRKQAGSSVPVLFYHDFSSELERWDTLSSRYDEVYYCRQDAGAIDVADLIRTIVEKRGRQQV